MYSYDTYLAQRADKYMDNFCQGEPKVVSAEMEYEPDGNSISYTYSCQECENKDCEYWQEYNM